MKVKVFIKKEGGIESFVRVYTYSEENATVAEEKIKNDFREELEIYLNKDNKWENIDIPGDEFKTKEDFLDSCVENEFFGYPYDDDIELLLYTPDRIDNF